MTGVDVPTFTLYIDQDVSFTAASDAVATELASTIHDAINALVDELLPLPDVRYRATQARRGTHHKVVFDNEYDQEADRKEAERGE